jgi:RecG-like helicase
MLRRLTSSEHELQAEELRQDTAEVGATPIAETGDRTRVKVCGMIKTVTLRPRAGVPALLAELYDGTETLQLVWLGRRQITGIEPGRSLVAEGRVTVQQGRRTMFNPRYELRPSGQ